MSDYDDYSDKESDIENSDIEDNEPSTIKSNIKIPYSDPLENIEGEPDDADDFDQDDESEIDEKPALEEDTNIDSDMEDDDEVEDVDEDDDEYEEDDDDTEKTDIINKKTKKPRQPKKSELKMASQIIQYEDDNDDNDEEDQDDDYDERYLDKFSNDITKNYITSFHPECLNHNYDEISKLSVVVKNEDGIIIDPLHKTIPFLTKYEKARILGQRAKQIETGAKPLVKVPDNIIDSHIIAELELREKKIPFIIRRPIPGGACEYWNIIDLENINF